MAQRHADVGQVHYKLTPLAMRVPNSRGVYAPSRLSKPKVIDFLTFMLNYNSIEALVSFENDGLSNPEKTTAYGYGLDCWYLAEFATNDDLHSN